MKRRSEKIRKVMSVAAAEEQRTGQALGRSRQTLNAHVERLGELNAYRQAYVDKSRGVGRMTIVHWKDYQNFLAKLDQAVQSQQQIIRDGEQNLDTHKQRWLVTKQRLESLGRVLERYESEEVAHAERVEQRALDDLPAIPDLFSKSAPDTE